MADPWSVGAAAGRPGLPKQVTGVVNPFAKPPAVKTAAAPPTLQQKRDTQNATFVAGIQQHKAQLQAHPVHGTVGGLAHTVQQGIKNTTGVNLHGLKHPLAALEGKGEFAAPTRTFDGKQVPFYAQPLPWFGGSKVIEEGAAKAAPVLGPKTLAETVQGALRGAPAARRAQEALRTPERGARIGEYSAAAESAPTAAGHHAAMAALKGKYPTLDYKGFKDFSPAAIDAMHEAVATHPRLDAWQKLNARTAIDSIAEGKVPTKSEQRILNNVFATASAPARYKLHQTVWQHVKDVLNTPRSLMASYDVSGAARQALLLATGHPVVWAKNLPPMFRSLASEDYYNTAMERDVYSRPNATNGVYDDMGLQLTSLAPKGSTALREESFASPLAEKIPGVRMSGRAFTYFLDKGRADLADIMYANAVKAGKAENPDMLKSIGDVANSATGRGDLGTGVVGRSADGINLLLFSPRLIKSRIDFLNPRWYAKLDPLARHEAYRAMGGLAVMMSTVLGIASAAGAKVNLDPRSSDFAKIKIGTTRLDLGGGFQQYIRVLSELATQQTVTSKGLTVGLAPFRSKPGIGKTSDFDILFRFLRAKLAPVSSGVVDVTQGQNVVGQPISVRNTLLPRFTPLSVQDAVSVGQATAKGTKSPLAGVGAGLGAFGLSAFGGGVQQYSSKPPKLKKTPDPWNVSGGGGGADPWSVSP